MYDLRLTIWDLRFDAAKGWLRRRKSCVPEYLKET